MCLIISVLRLCIFMAQSEWKWYSETAEKDKYATCIFQLFRYSPFRANIISLIRQNGVNMYNTYTMDLAGRTLRVDINRVGKQANGCAFMQYGETTVLCTATASVKPREGIDFFPLSVEYEEKPKIKYLPLFI